MVNEKLYKWCELITAGGVVVCTIAFLIMLCIIIANGCGVANSDSGVRAVEIPGPVNTVCFAIQENGKTIGGNCLWAR